MNPIKRSTLCHISALATFWLCQVCLAQQNDAELAMLLQHPWELVDGDHGDSEYADKKLALDEHDIYKLHFKKDGHVLIQAGCNYGYGRWEREGPVTLVTLSQHECPRGKFYETFLSLFEWNDILEGYPVTGFYFHDQTFRLLGVVDGFNLAFKTTDHILSGE